MLSLNSAYNSFMKNKVNSGPGQESVWDYTCPPGLQHADVHIVIIFNHELIAVTTNAIKITEACHPPVYYIPAGIL